MSPVALLFGFIVGASLGLTGGGGAIFAVPLLVYGLHAPTREAIGISLAAVGATALVGFLHRWRLGEVELRTGLLFALAGMLGAPIGSRIAGLLPEHLLMLAFAVLMGVVAWRLWEKASAPVTKPAACSPETPGSADPACPVETTAGPTCQRDAQGALRLTSRCAVLLLLVGVATGLLSGLFGVGGGFVIVPALVLFSSMPIHRAVGTSLMVIALVSASGLAAQSLGGQAISWPLTALFVVGGVLGLFAGQQLGRRLSGPLLQRVFAVAIVGVACFVVVKNIHV
ncbi:MAG TPA: sulfite exporter TauE/SafE family protein [Pirellulales bacterium]